MENAQNQPFYKERLIRLVKSCGNAPKISRHYEMISIHSFHSLSILIPFPLSVSTLMQSCQVPPEVAAAPAPAAEAEGPAEEAQCGFESPFLVSNGISEWQ